MAVGATLTACDPDEPLERPGLPGLPGEEPDLAQVRRALLDEQRVLEQVARVRRRHRQLRRPLAATAAVHEAHVELLRRAADDDPGEADGNDAAEPRPRVPAAPATAVAELIRLERSLAAEHVETAMASRSGVLARLVAALSAAAAQQAVVLLPLAGREAVTR